MYRRIVVISHLWPGVTPFNVWDLPWHLWAQYAAAHDEWVRANREVQS